MKKPGYFVVSLDFELMWGMIDKVSVDSYRDNLLGARAAIPEILTLFRSYDIHATWATVGMLMHDDYDDLVTDLPPADLRPSYRDTTLSSYAHIFRQPEVIKADPDCYFAPDLVHAILGTPHQELASHTFSHYYCIDGKRNNQAVFAADCTAMNRLMGRFSVVPSSIVFPRNQTTKEALTVCEQFKLTAYRGTEDHFLYWARTDRQQNNLFIRVLRLLDHYFNLSGHHTYPVPEDTPLSGPTNLPASRFFRPYSKLLRFLEPLRLRRIKKAMTHAAKRGEVFHLWWHPHNFGTYRKENLQNLLCILEHYQTLQNEYGMESVNMYELATRARVPRASESVATADQ